MTLSTLNTLSLDIGGKLRLSDARRDREEKREDQQRRGQRPANTIDKQARIRERFNKARMRVLANPQLPNYKDVVIGYFVNGYLKLTLVNNVDDGYLTVNAHGMGNVLTEAQLAYLRADNAQRAAVGLPLMPMVPWERENQGILNYGPATDALNAVGFGKFVNFFGRKDAFYYAMEVPLAEELGFFRADWFADPPQLFDQDWAAGGDGPYIAEEDVFAPPVGAEVPIDGVDLAQPDASILSEIAEEEAYYASYQRQRAMQPGTYDMDQQLPVAAPTIQETSEGTIPPSQAAGNPGLEPTEIVPEDSNVLRPPPATIKLWADKLIAGCWQMTVEDNPLDRYARQFRPNPVYIQQQEIRLYRDDFFDAADEPWLSDLRAVIDAGREVIAYDRSVIMTLIKAQVQRYVTGAEPWPDVRPHMSPEVRELVSKFENKLQSLIQHAADEGVEANEVLGYNPLNASFDAFNALIEERVFRQPVPDQILYLHLTTLLETYQRFQPDGIRGWAHANRWPLVQQTFDFLYKWEEVGRALVRGRLVAATSTNQDRGAWRYSWNAEWQQRVALMGPLFEPQSPIYDPGTPRGPQSPLYNADSYPRAPTRPGAPSQNSPSLQVAPPRADVAIPPGGPPDPPPSSSANVRSVQEVQVAVVQRSALMAKPAAAAYHPIVDVRTTNLFSKGVKSINELGTPGEWDARKAEVAAKTIFPTINKRSGIFYLKTDPLTVGRNLHAFFTDRSLTVSGALWAVKVGNPPRMKSFVPAKIFTASEKQSNDLLSRVTFSMQADHEQSLGFFGREQLQHVYDHMIYKGNVMFSVNANKAIQFFPSEFVCSNVWWWESRLNQVPQSLEWNQIGSGSYNKAFRLINANPSNGRLPDHFLFLPPTRIGYGMSLQQPGIEKAFAATKQNGIIMRVAYYPGVEKDRGFGMQAVVRELMLSALAASAGFGPRIYAAYIIPGDAYPPNMAMNPGDENAAFADPLYRAGGGGGSAGGAYMPHNAPPSAWYESRFYWNSTGIIQRPNARYISPNFEASKTNTWRKMVVVMESFADNVGALTLQNDTQTGLLARALWASIEKMSESGFLHMDIKYLNMVQRTWRKDNVAVDAANPWNAIEVRVIDFDPRYVKLCPWLPKEVLTLINIVCYLAFNKCFDRHQGLYGKLSKKLKELHAYVNKNYPDGVAGAFRALTPPLSKAHGAESLPGVRGRNPSIDRTDSEIFQMFNDEWEASRVFYHWFKNYMETRRCAAAFAAYKDSKTSMLARLMSYAKVKSLRQANAPTDPKQPGVFEIGSAPYGGVCGGNKKGKEEEEEKEEERGEEEEILASVVSVEMGRGLWGDVYNFGSDDVAPVEV